MNVSELIRKLNTTREELLDRLPELGFDVGKRAIKIPPHMVDPIVRAWSEDKKKRRKAEEVKRKEAIEAEAERIRQVREEQKDMNVQVGDEVELPEKMVIKDLAKMLNFPVTDLLAILMRNGIMSSMNEEIDFETASIIVEDLGFTVKKQKEDTNKKQAQDSAFLDQILRNSDPKDLRDRPPVVVVMGHVDHGKTKLLDAIRQTHVVDEEAGGITQAIGAYQVAYKKKVLTFIDTPGHEAFTAMRSRGARVADIAILVVAADDGVKPQTKEALNIVKQAGLPFIVAINKIDKEEADIDKVKKELSDLGVSPEDWGGNTICVPISAKAQTNIDDILEMLLLVADMHKDSIVADPKRDALGTIIDSRVDKGEGPLGTVLIQAGTLHQGDTILVGDIPGRVKAMKDFTGKITKQAIPSTPVQILGLKDVPTVGDVLQVVKDKKLLKKKMKSYKSHRSFQVSSDNRHRTGSRIEKDTLPLIVKADTLGALEALIQSLNKIEHAEIELKIVDKGLGNINERDVIEAVGQGALVIGFNVSLIPGAIEAQQKEDVEIFTHQIIYNLIDKVKENMTKMLSPETYMESIGKLKILAIFKKNPSSVIAGGNVIDGILKSNTEITIYRNEEEIGKGKITQLQLDKKNAGSVKSGQECGMKLQVDTEIQEGDVIEAFRVAERERSLE